jgi:hypothetical protein
MAENKLLARYSQMLYNLIFARSRAEAYFESGNVRCWRFKSFVGPEVWLAQMVRALTHLRKAFAIFSSNFLKTCCEAEKTDTSENL